MRVNIRSRETGSSIPMSPPKSAIDGTMLLLKGAKQTATWYSKSRHLPSFVRPGGGFWSRKKGSQFSPGFCSSSSSWVWPGVWSLTGTFSSTTPGFAKYASGGHLSFVCRLNRPFPLGTWLVPSEFRPHRETSLGSAEISPACEFSSP